MKKILFSILAVMIIVSSGLTAQTKIRIGVYDSRAVALCEFNSESFQKEMLDLRAKYMEAKEKKDTVLTKKLEEKGKLTQRILHDKGFGRGSVAEIMEKKSKEIKELATKEKLTVIISKWELNYYGSDVELVDITQKVAEIFAPSDHVKKWLEGLDKNPPIKDAFFLED